MTPELTMLALSVVLLFVVIVFQAVVATAQYGGGTLMGNRDALEPPGRYLSRVRRAVDNLRENLLMFAPLVLIAAAADISTPQTVLGAQVFFGARVVHAVLYLIGIPFLRTLAWAAGVVGMALILLELFKF